MFNAQFLTEAIMSLNASSSSSTSTSQSTRNHHPTTMPILEEQRTLCEDLERLEQACADRVLEDPRTVNPTLLCLVVNSRANFPFQIRDRLLRDHQIANFVDRFQSQSQRLLEIVRDTSGARQAEVEVLSASDPFDSFYSQLNNIKDFHRRYPNEPVENLERAYRSRVGDIEEISQPWYIPDLDAMFTGEESNGRFFDLTQLHEDYLNLPGIKRITYLHYLSQYDKFESFPITQKHSEKYFQYVTGLAEYLESFLRRTRPLDNPEKIISDILSQFAEAWSKDEVPGWGKNAPTKAQPANTETAVPAVTSLYCDACEKAFTNKNVYDHHFSSKKHIKAAAAKVGSTEKSVDAAEAAELARLKDRAIAEREWRITKLTELMKSEREATATNVERKQSLTERERQMELEAFYAEAAASAVPNSSGPGGDNDENLDDEDEDSKIHNPLKLPLAWDGKPIPYWLYKLHGLGVEFPCEICGNFVYRGRRAFDKHFNEYRHIHGLRCLGITNTTLFREITKIDEAQRLWEKLEQDKRKSKLVNESVEEMEDASGNVMPRKVFEDLQKQGLL